MFGFGLATVVFAPVIALLDSVGIASTFYILAAVFLVLVCGAARCSRCRLPVGNRPDGTRRQPFRK